MGKKKGVFVDYTKKEEAFAKKEKTLRERLNAVNEERNKVFKALQKQIAEKERTLTLDQNKLMCSLILDIGFDFSDLTIVLGSLLKAKEVIDGADNNAKNQLINDCIARYNKFANENDIVIKGFNELEDYQKKEGQTDNNVEKP